MAKNRLRKVRHAAPVQFFKTLFPVNPFEKCFQGNG